MKSLQFRPSIIASCCHPNLLRHPVSNDVFLAMSFFTAVLYKCDFFQFKTLA